MKYILLVFLFGISQDLIPQQSSTIKVMCDKKKSFISYSMNHPMHAWTGENKDVNAVILCSANKSSVSKVAVSTKISGFDSKNANRDSHVMETTEAIKFPSVSFTSDSIKENGNQLQVYGKLNFHGVSKPLQFAAIKSLQKEVLEIKGNFVIKMSQHNIDPPSLMGIATDDEIKIAFTMVF